MDFTCKNVFVFKVYVVHLYMETNKLPLWWFLRTLQRADMELNNFHLKIVIIYIIFYYTVAVVMQISLI